MDSIDLEFGVGAAMEIDEITVLWPSGRRQVISGLSVNPDHLIIDALPLPEAGLPFRAIVKADALCRSVSAASIVAKVARDGHMNMEDSKYPGYGFARHKGYGTSEHLKQLARLGPCPIHRRSFAPVRELDPSR